MDFPFDFYSHGFIEHFLWSKYLEYKDHTDTVHAFMNLLLINEYGNEINVLHCKKETVK